MSNTMRWIAIAAFAASSAAAALDTGSATVPELTAEQIVEKNVAARGGLEAWRKIQTMIWVGHMDRAGASMPSMPFVLQQKRPDKTRFELTGVSQKSLRVFDGAHGWKVRPASDGSPDVEAYTPQEVRFAQGEPVIDGPLIDYQAKGIAVTLQGVEEVEGHKAYRLNLKLASGERNDVWIDTQTFLDIKYDRRSYSSHGVPGTVSVLYRNYKDIGGLQIPSVLEIGTGSGKVPDKMVIEKIALNPPVEDRMFTRPGRPSRRHMVTIEAEPSQSPTPALRAPPNPSPAAGPNPGTARK
jgi:hypothetical protein